MPLRESLSAYWQQIQGQLFPALVEELGPLGERHRKLVTVLELVRPETFLPHLHGLVARNSITTSPCHSVEFRMYSAAAFVVSSTVMTSVP